MPVNPNVQVTVAPDGAYPVQDFLFYGTNCEYYLSNQTADRGGTVYASDGQSCELAPNGNCTMLLAFDTIFGSREAVRGRSRTGRSSAPRVARRVVITAPAISPPRRIATST